MYFETPFFLVSFTPHPTVVWIAQALIALSLLLALGRLVKGPNVVDRVVALDLIAGIILAYTIFHAIVQQEINFMNVTIAIAVIAFLGTVAIARYLERRVTFNLKE